MMSLFMSDQEFDNAIQIHQKACSSKAIKIPKASLSRRGCSKKEVNDHYDNVEKMNKLSCIGKIKIVIFRG